MNELTVEDLKQAIIVANDCLQASEGVELNYYIEQFNSEEEVKAMQTIKRVLKEAV
jgi:hypothetical protein